MSKTKRATYIATVAVWCPSCNREHRMEADAAPFRAADRRRVMCDSCRRGISTSHVPTQAEIDAAREQMMEDLM